MKKFLAIAVSVLFLLGFAASAFAIHAEIPSETQAAVAKGDTQVTLGGSIRIRGEIREADFNDKTTAASWYDERVRLSTAVKSGDNVSGMIELESTNSSYSGSADAYTWGGMTACANGVYGTATNSGNCKQTDVQILQAWILYTNDTVNAKVGHMPLALGNLIFFDHRKFGDDAIVLYKDIENLHVAALTIKMSEGTTTVSDDSDAYVALLSYKGDGFNVSGDVTWVNDNKFLQTAGYQADLYNFGIRGDVNVTDNVKLMADFELQTGDAEGLAAGNLSALSCGLKDCDFSGYALMVGATAKVDPVDLGLTVGVGSGDDNTADGDIDTYVTSLSSGVPYVGFVYGTRTSHASGFANAGYANTTFVKASVSGSPADKLKAQGDLIWLRATEDMIPYVGASATDDLGWEIDGTVSYDVAKNLKYWVEGGYMFAGDAYNISATQAADDAYAIRHGIELSF